MAGLELSAISRVTRYVPENPCGDAVSGPTVSDPSVGLTPSTCDAVAPV
jgi:hypothetical protein